MVLDIQLAADGAAESGELAHHPLLVLRGLGDGGVGGRNDLQGFVGVCVSVSRPFGRQTYTALRTRPALPKTRR